MGRALPPVARPVPIPASAGHRGVLRDGPALVRPLRAAQSGFSARLHLAAQFRAVSHARFRASPAVLVLRILHPRGLVILFSRENGNHKSIFDGCHRRDICWLSRLFLARIIANIGHSFGLTSPATLTSAVLMGVGGLIAIGFSIARRPKAGFLAITLLMVALVAISQILDSPVSSSFGRVGTGTS